MYESGIKLLQLVKMLQRPGARVGYREIEEAFGISRRTAERLIETIACEFHPQFRELPAPEGGRFKRFAFDPKAPRGIPTPDLKAEELSALQQASNLLRREGIREQAEHIETLRLKLLEALKEPQSQRMQRNADDLDTADAFVLRPGPDERTDPKVVQKLREAVLLYNAVRIRYRSRRSGKLRTLTVHPYGFLNGRRRYLVAFHPKRGIRAFRNFVIANIKWVTLLKDNIFEHDENFDLYRYAAESFGAFREPPVKVLWRFSKAAAPDARRWIFHPSQEIEEQADGTLLVRFTAGGQNEMVWHLFTWGNEVEVLEPAELRERLAEWKRM